MRWADKAVAAVFLTSIGLMIAMALAGFKFADEDATYMRKHGFEIILTYGTSGNANGNVEYICAAEPGAATTDASWQVRRLTYDSDGNVTNVEWAGSQDRFNQQCDSPSSLSY